MLPPADCLQLTALPLWVAFVLGATITVLVLIVVWAWLTIK